MNVVQQPKWIISDLMQKLLKIFNSVAGFVHYYLILDTIHYTSYQQTGEMRNIDVSAK